MNNAVDQFYAQNIDAFLEKPLDEIVIGVDNDEVINHHIPYLLHEAEWNLSSKDEADIGPTLFKRAVARISSSKPIRGDHPPDYQRLSPRGTSGSMYSLRLHGKEIGIMSDAQRFREAYIGAIYSHCGKTYRVVSHGAKTARKALQVIPGIGTGIGASVNGWYIKGVGWTARRAFQEKWSIDNRKLFEI